MDLPGTVNVIEVQDPKVWCALVTAVVEDALRLTVQGVLLLDSIALFVGRHGGERL